MMGAPPAGGGGFGDLGNILLNPLVQTALGTYLGAISSPRMAGWGGALGRGGLTGLQAGTQAALLQRQMPLIAAQTAAYQSLPGYRQAAEQRMKAQTEQEAPIGDDAEARIRQQNPEFAKQYPQGTLAKLSWTNLNKDFEDFRKIQAESGKTEATIGAEKARTKLYETQQQELGPKTDAEIARDRAEAAKAGRPEMSGLVPVYGPGGATDVLWATKGQPVPKGYSPKAPEPGDTAAGKLQSRIDNLIKNYNSIAGTPPSIDPMGTRLPTYKEGLRKYLVSAGIPPDIAATQAGVTTGIAPPPLMPASAPNAAPTVTPASTPPRPADVGPDATHGTHKGVAGWYDPGTGNFHPDA